MVARPWTGPAGTPEAGNDIPDDVPKELTNQIHECQVNIPDVLKEMQLAVDTLFAAKRDDTGSSEHEGKAL